MPTWDKTTPVGTEGLTQGDDRIRDAKENLEDALSHEDSTFPGATPATPIFIPGFLRGATGSRPTGDSLVSGRFYVNTTLNVLERYNGSSWDVVGTVIPDTTKMVFYQASAPTGWTADAVNDKFLRVVTAGGTGGTTGGTLAASANVELAHTHTFTGDGHQHLKGGTVATGTGFTGGDLGTTSVAASGTTGSNTPASSVLARADVIIATKD